MKARLIAVVLLCATVSMTAGAQNVETIAPPGLPTSAFPKPDRPVAEIISPIWATEEERDAADESGQIVRGLGLRSGMNIADLGAGSGYHAMRLARALGPESHIFAEDVVPFYLAGLKARVEREGATTITVLRGEPHDPRLPANSVDAAILVHMYHEIAQPFGFLYNLVPALKANAKVGIIDLDRPIGSHGTRPDLLRCELAALGYKQTSFIKLTGDVGYLAVFTPPNITTRTPPDEIKVCAAPGG